MKIKLSNKAMKSQKVTCDKCDKQFSNNNNIILHNLSIHEGVCYSCDYCDYKAAQKRRFM